MVSRYRAKDIPGSQNVEAANRVTYWADEYHKTEDTVYLEVTDVNDHYRYSDCVTITHYGIISTNKVIPC